jgi:hypothetical protein
MPGCRKTEAQDKGKQQNDAGCSNQQPRNGRKVTSQHACFARRSKETRRATAQRSKDRLIDESGYRHPQG